MSGYQELLSAMKEAVEEAEKLGSAADPDVLILKAQMQAIEQIVEAGKADPETAKQLAPFEDIAGLAAASITSEKDAYDEMIEHFTKYPFVLYLHVSKDCNVKQLLETLKEITGDDKAARDIVGTLPIGETVQVLSESSPKKASLYVRKLSEIEGLHAICEHHWQDDPILKKSEPKWPRGQRAGDAVLLRLAPNWVEEKTEEEAAEIVKDVLGISEDDAYLAVTLRHRQNKSLAIGARVLIEPLAYRLSQRGLPILTLFKGDLGPADGLQILDEIDVSKLKTKKRAK